MRFVFSVCLFLVMSVLQAASLQDRFAGLDSSSTEFTQELFDADRKLLETSKGILRIQRPDRFNLEYRDPYYQLYVADGQNLYFYDKDLEQVTVTAQKDILDRSPAMLLSNPARLNDLYIVNPQGETDGLAWYALTPRQPGSSFDTIKLAFAGKELRIMELQDSFGQTTRLTFQNLRQNPDLDPALFRFTPPAGIDVIQQ
ncbi:MAG: outer membrane lipoprotein chaperone LolA [Proteobacteria bacterium]|jgi:outer membrane lipoprotein carrier protein|nr:outer membrane lipoprotein chaperone LolA [Pseudomonadota bacterium]